MTKLQINMQQNVFNLKNINLKYIYINAVKRKHTKNKTEHFNSS